ncbi:gluconokinase [Microbacterium sp. YJN-G]|uniref:gluconokinase n=1 Tax=Microbacterium sp. YJN-G TaxID=2763257 RepID=UPI001878E7F6|nr:FGGY-family carbohydrate kinase [Microbacterium sp. YJN-G]
MIVLALEASTTSAKTMLFDTDTQQVAVTTRRFDGDGVVRDGDSVFTQLMALGREAAAGVAVDAIALSSTWHGLTLRRPDLSAITPVYEWPYTGARELTARYREDAAFTSWFYERTGCMVNAIFPAFKIAHLAETGVDIAGALVLDQGSLTFARMTGEIWTSRTVASGTGLLATDGDDWDPQVRAALGIEGIVLPRLVSSDTSAPLVAEVATLLGVRAGIPVMIPGPDGGLSQVGDRAYGVGDMTFSMGTSGALRYTTAHPAFSPTMGTWAYRSPFGWLSGAATSGCGNCVDWAKGLLFGTEMTFAEIEPMLDPERTALPVFLPFLFGERSPGWQDQRAGGFLEVRPEHTRADLYQAVLQGIVFSLYHCYKELAALNGPPRRVLISGGVLSSPFWAQLTADVFQIEMQVSSQQHASVVGATRLALRHLGLDDDQPGLRSEEPRMLVPDPARAEGYRLEFERYLDAYARTSPGTEIGAAGSLALLG